MSEQSPRITAPLAPLPQQSDQICDHFEAAWKAVAQGNLWPRIEDYLGDVPESERLALLVELIALDVAYRRRCGEAPNVEEYRKRFAKLDSARLASAFAAPPSPIPPPLSTPMAPLNDTPPGDGEAAGTPTPVKRIRCPHCHNPIQLGHDRSDEVLCPACGSTFRVQDSRLTSTTSEMRQLGKFKLLERVGLGAFGAVWKARDTELDRLVALKIPHSGLVTGSAELERFHREARAAAQLRHPGIVTVHEVTTLDGLPTIVSDFITGVPLKDVLQERCLTFREAATLITHAAEALHYAHSMGVVHRDIKPANIMVERAASDQSSEAKEKPLTVVRLVDFGLALREEAEIRMTVEGQLLGTPAYMSPEQAAGKGHRVDGRSDVYCLGVVLYELLTGELPFRGSKAMILDQVLHEEPRPPRRINDKIPRDLETICLRAMTKEPGRRYGKAREMADDLRRWLNGEPIMARPVGQVEKLLKFTKRHRAVVGAVSMTLLALTVALITSFSLLVRTNEAQAARLAEVEARTGEKDARDAEANLKVAVAEAHRASAIAYGRAAKVAAQQGDYRAALDHYNKALDLNHPDPIGLRLGRLKCYDALLEADLYGAEVDALAQRTDLDAYKGQVTLEKARLSIWRRPDYGDAQTLLKQALQEGLPPTEEAVSRAWLADTVPDAVRFLLQASRLDPYNVDARVQLLIFLFLSGRYDELHQTLAQLQVLRPNDPLLLLMQAFMIALNGDMVAAEANLDNLAKQGAVDEADMGRFLVRRMMPLLAGDPFGDTPNTGLIGFLKDAIPLVMRLQRRYEGKAAGAGLFPLKPVFDSPFSKKLIQHLMAGFSQALFFQYSAAADEIGKMTRINPEGLMYCVHASFLVEAGRLPEAEQALLRAIEVPSMLRHGRQAALAGLIAVEDREMDAVKGSPDPKLKARLVDNLRKLAASTPLGPDGARSMAVVAMKAGEYRLALRFLDDCERGRPGNRDLAELRARALLGLGAYEQARATAAELLRTQSSDKYARQIVLTAEARQKNAAVALLAASPADAPEVAKLASQVALTGAPSDANAVSWSPEPTAGQASSLDGQWFFRWSSQKKPGIWTTGKATVRTLGDRVYIEMTGSDRRLLLEAQRSSNRLLGRLINLANATDATPWVGLIVDPERIDGQYPGGRWDLRRLLPEVLTVPPLLELEPNR